MRQVAGVISAHETSMGLLRVRRPAKQAFFSFVTLTSTGYGDIVPIHPFARSLCNIEGIIGQLYPATLLARLVSLAIVRPRA